MFQTWHVGNWFIIDSDVVNFLSQLIVIFPLFLGMVMYANEVETKEKWKLPEIKINYNNNIMLNIIIIFIMEELALRCNRVLNKGRST